MSIAAQVGDRTGSLATTVTISVVVGALIAIAILLLNFPGFDLSWRVTGIILLSVLASANLLALLGTPRRVREWRVERRFHKALNKTSRLVPDLQEMVSETDDLLYENRQGSLFNLATRITERSANLDDLDRRRLVEYQFRVLAAEFKMMQELAESVKSWERLPFVYFVRRIGEHFQLVDPVMEICTDIGTFATLEHDILTSWESFKENYNQLRSRWGTYFRRVPGATGLHVQIKGEPARSMPTPSESGE